MTTRRRTHAGLATALFAALACILSAPAAAVGPDATVNGSCLRCHSMGTFARRAPTGEVENLSVNPKTFSASEIGALPCTRCHDAGFKRFPHPKRPPLQFAAVLGKNKPDLAGAPLAEIQNEFKQSVHFQKHPTLFTCFRCHDPHSFRRWREVTRQSVAERNAICLRCHASQENYSRIAGRRVPDLSVVHAWLPHAEIHMAQVRCLDCHASAVAPSHSHLIMPKSQAVRDCVKCHSANTVLRDKLYKHERGQEMARLGFANALIVNNTYVIGATRNRILDTLGALIVLGTLAGMGGHTVLRTRGRGPSGHAGEDK
ncbi:MAG TPA: cytochrome c3 family protein [Armatimonadota bacterium]|jgi:predicted CXXCH cytochrome family protein